MMGRRDAVPKHRIGSCDRCALEHIVQQPGVPPHIAVGHIFHRKTVTASGSHDARIAAPKIGTKISRQDL